MPKKNSRFLSVPLRSLQTAEPTAAATAELSPTPDARPLPKDWRNWPIVPALSPWLQDVYEVGIEQGNDPSHFSKAGDCQNIPEAFLGFYDVRGRYSFAEDEEYLQATERLQGLNA